MNLLEIDPEKLYEVLGCSEELGLSSEQAQINLKEFGPNTHSGRFKKRFGVFKRIFGDVMLLVFLAMTLYVIAAKPSPEISATLWITLGGYLLLTVCSSLYVEWVLNKVKRFSASSCRVKRDGKLRWVDSQQIVPGDRLYLERGEVLPCDGIVMRKRSLKVLEANVTGKCDAVIKREYRDVVETELPYFDCILFAGTVILNGSATVLVCNTGKNIFDANNPNVKRSGGEMPKIHSELKNISKQLSLLWIPVSFFIFALGVICKQSLFSMFYYSLALMIAAMPDGLRLLSELGVAMQVRSLMRRGCVIKNYAAVNKLSSVNCVTVHTEEFVLEKYPVIGTFLVDDCPYPFKERPKYATSLLELAMLCKSGKNPPLMTGGRNVDEAIERAGEELGLKTKRLERQKGLLSRREYDASRGYSSALCLKNEQYRYVIRGTPESVLRRCSHIKKGERTPFLNESAKLRLMDTARAIAANGEYVVAIALLDCSSPPEEREVDRLTNLLFVGFLGLYPPVRTGAAQAISQWAKNGVDTLLLTADSPERSFGLAKKLSMIRDGDYPYALEEKRYRTMDRGLFLADLNHYKVFCGLDPGQQRDVVRSRNQNGDITACVSDSLSSSVAQSEADVSFAYFGADAGCVRQNADVLLKRRSLEGVLRTFKSVQAICLNSCAMLRHELCVHFTLAILALLSMTCFGGPVVKPYVLIAYGLFVGYLSSVAVVGSIPLELPLCHREKRALLTRCALVYSCAGGALAAVATCLSYRVVMYYTSLEALSHSAATITLFVGGLLLRFVLVPDEGKLLRKDEFGLWNPIAILSALTILAALLFLLPHLTNTLDAIPDLVTVIIATVIGLLPSAFLGLIKKLTARSCS